jgi:hypothetical protein
MASTRSQSRQSARRIVDDVRLDTRHTLRGLRANPAFAVIAILTLAVGIGAATSIFSVLNATLLRPLPFRDPARLMSPLLRMPVQYGSGSIDMSWSYPKFQTFLASQRVFQDVALHMTDAPTLGGPDGAERETGELVGAHYFAILGLAPQRGRFFLDAEDRPSGGSRSVVIGDGLWRRRMGADPNVVGHTLEINNASYTIVGIAPPGFSGMTGSANLWTLFTAARDASTLQGPTVHQFEAVARLAPIPLLRGRAFTLADRRGAPSVAVINQEAARTIWGSDDPLTVPIAYQPAPTAVVGIVGDVAYENISAPPKPAVYVPMTQSARSRGLLIVRTAGDPLALAAAVLREIKAVDRNHTVANVATMRARLYEATTPSRFSTEVLVAFAVIALLLASIGIYGVLSLAVAQRTRELGVRLALGATPGAVLAMVLGQAMTLVALGAVAGLLGAGAAAGALRGMLYGVGTVDAATYITSTLVLAVAAFVAALVPALRATRVSPMVALRSE